MTIPWTKPPDTPWTKKQVVRKTAERNDYLRSRTDDRSDQSVAEGVAKLNQLIKVASENKLVVALAWKIDGNREIKMEVDSKPRDTFSASDYSGRLATMKPEEAVVLRLRASGLQWGAYDGTPPCPGIWKPVPETSFPALVRRFQLFPDELEELMKLIQMD